MLNRYRKCVFALVAICFIAACGYTEGVIQKDSVAYLWFTGNTEQAFVSLDGKEFFPLSRIPESQEGKLTYYQVPPGKHRVTVKKGSEVVVDRIFIVGNGTIKEVQIP